MASRRLVIALVGLVLPGIGTGQDAGGYYAKVEVKGDLAVDAEFKFEPNPNFRKVKLSAYVRGAPVLTEPSGFGLVLADRTQADFVTANAGKRVIVRGELGTALRELREGSAQTVTVWFIRVKEIRLADPRSFLGSKPGDGREVAGVKLCWCPPGTFTMGSPPGEPERRPDEGQVQVRLTRGFWAGKYEVTQGQWKRVMGALPGASTAELPEGDDYPVGNVNFAEAEAFCRRLTEQSRRAGDLPAGWEFRLPTEAQWEYACRAGTATATAFGDKLSRTQANFKGAPYNGAGAGPSLGKAAQVGRYPANAWGLHDMHGNTYEWCRDWYHPRLPGGVDPDLHDAPATSRVRRGGGWTDDGWACRSAFRLRFEPERRYDHIGFRVVAVQP